MTISPLADSRISNLFTISYSFYWVSAGSARSVVRQNRIDKGEAYDRW